MRRLFHYLEIILIIIFILLHVCGGNSSVNVRQSRQPQFKRNRLSNWTCTIFCLATVQSEREEVFQSMLFRNVLYGVNEERVCFNHLLSVGKYPLI